MFSSVWAARGGRRAFPRSALTLFKRLAQGGQPLLLLAPIAAAGDGTVDHQVVAVDEAGFVAGEKYRGMGDIVGQARARYGLLGLVDLAHRRRRLLRGLGRKAERLG